MARARNWDRLSVPYRRRLERAGISRSDYMSGQSLKRARGHSNTPEHPTDRVDKTNIRYWLRKIGRKVERELGDIHSFRKSHALYPTPAEESDIDDIDPESIEFALSVSEEEMRHLAGQGGAWWFLFYH